MNAPSLEKIPAPWNTNATRPSGQVLAAAPNGDGDNQV
jgi:hypothetical protein